MTKNPARRLGCTSDGENQIRTHTFFKDMDWDALENRKVKPPFRPRVVSKPKSLATIVFASFYIFRKLHTKNVGV